MTVHSHFIMDNSSGIRPIELVEMLDIDEGVLVTMCSGNKDSAKVGLYSENATTLLIIPKETECDLVAVLAEKENLIELGYYHVQALRAERDVLQKERDAARSELENFRKAAKVEVEAIQSTAAEQLGILWNVRSFYLELVLNLISDD